MHANKILINCVLILGVSFSGLLQASNWQWLKDAPLMSFDEQDMELLGETIHQALEQDTDGNRRDWHNPKTGHSGDIQVLDTRETDVGKCRLLLISNKAKPEKGVSRLTYCRQPDGEWKIDNRKKMPSTTNSPDT